MTPSRSSLVLVLGLTAAGCATGPRMRAARPQLPAAPRGEAQVIFVRPSRAAPKIVYTIFDEKGRFLGDSSAGSHFVARLAPGHHVFFNAGNHTDALDADLAAGRTYFVEVTAHKKIHLLAIAPGGRLWDRRDGYVAHTRPLEANPRAGQAFLDARGSRVQRRIDRGVALLAKYPTVEKARHTLAPNDGV
jgi:hypothetical protein